MYRFLPDATFETTSESSFSGVLIFDSELFFSAAGMIV